MYRSIDFETLKRLPLSKLIPKANELILSGNVDSNILITHPMWREIYIKAFEEDFTFQMIAKDDDMSRYGKSFLKEYFIRKHVLETTKATMELPRSFFYDHVIALWISMPHIYTYKNRGIVRMQIPSDTDSYYMNAIAIDFTDNVISVSFTNMEKSKILKIGLKDLGKTVVISGYSGEVINAYDENDVDLIIKWKEYMTEGSPIYVRVLDFLLQSIAIPLIVPPLAIYPPETFNLEPTLSLVKKIDTVHKRMAMARPAEFFKFLSISANQQKLYTETDEIAILVTKKDQQRVHGLYIFKKGVLSEREYWIHEEGNPADPLGCIVCGKHAKYYQENDKHLKFCSSDCQRISNKK